MVYHMESETIDLKPLMPLVNAYTQLLGDEERKKLYEEARAKINNDEEFLRRLEEKGEDERALLLPYVGWLSHSNLSEVVEETVGYMRDNPEIVREYINKSRKEYSSEINVFRDVTSLLIATGYFKIMEKDVDEIKRYIADMRDDIEQATTNIRDTIKSDGK